MFMPLACFRYYIHAYLDYLLSDKSEGDSDGASCFFGLIEFREKQTFAQAETNCGTKFPRCFAISASDKSGTTPILTYTGISRRDRTRY